MNLKNLIGKGNIFIKTKDGTCYTINEVTDVNKTFISFEDKFNNYVSIAISEIIKLVDENHSQKPKYIKKGLNKKS